MIRIYGIPNCDTMKKAIKWLEKNNLDYEFHDYKKSGVPENKLKLWVKSAGWDNVLNKRGTTWRQPENKLSKTLQNNLSNGFTRLQFLMRSSQVFGIDGAEVFTRGGLNITLIYQVCDTV